MTPRTVPRAAAALLLLAAAPLAAQPTPSAPPAPPDTGARVRIARVRAFDVVGTLVAREPGRWLVRTARGDTVAFVPGPGRRLDVSVGTLSAREAFARTARPTANVLAAATLAAALVAEAADDDEACAYFCMSDGAYVAVTGLAVTAYGSVIAGLVGLSLRDRWVAAPLPADVRIGVGPTPRGVGVRVALR